MTPRSIGLAAAVLALVLSPTLTAAQSPVSPRATTGDPTVDSAAAARAHWSSANAALAANDTAAAYRHATRAAVAWPTQPTYLWGRAVTAALAADTTGTRDALAAYAAIGMGRDLRADAGFRAIVADPRSSALLEQLDANRRPVTNSRVAFELSDSTFWPEGIDHDPRTGRFYVTSVRHRTIVERLPDGAERELIPRQTPGIGAILAVRVDTARNALWATSSGLPQMAGYAPSDSSHGVILRIGLRDGVVERWNMPGGGKHMLGDIAVVPNGDVYVTSSSQPILYRFKSGDGTLERITSPLFRSLQGIATGVRSSYPGHLLYVADYSHGLLVLDPASGVIVRVRDAPQSTSLGIDGLVADGDALIAVQTGVAPARVMRFQLHSTGTAIASAELLDRNSTIADEPTAGVVVGRRLFYVGNSQWEKYDDAGRRRANVSLRRPVILELPLEIQR